ncbi:MAG: lnt [Acidimicrobiales bacterium]|nr:lnt [Acidimicrobiales bacterium]
MSRRRALTLLTCVAAGTLIALSLPPAGFWPLAFVGLALVDRLLAGVRWQRRWQRGALVGVALFGPTMLWISELTPPGYLVAVALFSVILGGFMALVPPGPGRRPALVGAWVLSEALRGVWPLGGVPMSILAVGQVAGPLAGVGRVGGTLLTAAVTVAVGLALAAGVRRQWRPAAIALAAALVGVGLAQVAPRGRDTGKRIDIGFVQGGGPQGTRAINTDMRQVFLRHLRASAKLPKGLDLVIWPEDVVDTDGPVQQFREGRELAALARRLDTTLVIGTVETVDDKRFANASQVLTRDGRWISRYDKFHRVPFGEYTPLRALIEKVAPDTLPAKDAVPGSTRAVVDTPVGKVAVVISWEVFFGNRARDGVGAGGQLLLNPTNGSTYTGTSVQTQQVASSRLRAIETGRWEVQVAPTGFSAFVSPEGKVLQRTSVSEQAVRVMRGVPLRSGRTLYVRWGDNPARLLALALVVAGWLVDRRERRRRGAPAAST